MIGGRGIRFCVVLVMKSNRILILLVFLFRSPFVTAPSIMSIRHCRFA